MPEPVDKNMQSRICSMFDSYCKTVLKNASRNIKRQIKNRSKREMIVEDTIYGTTYATYIDQYPSEQFVIQADGFSCIVCSEMLYNALMLLPGKQRKVLLLDFWYGWSDKSIAQNMKITTRTVYNLRQRAFLTIRSYYEGNL